MKQVYLFLFPFYYLTVFSQVPTDTLRLYYAVDKIVPYSYAVLDSLKSDAVIKNVRIVGHADYLHHAEYNLRLSQRRAGAVKDHLERSFPAIRGKILEYRGAGEHAPVANSSEGDQQWRRVDVIIEHGSSSKDASLSTRNKESTVKKDSEAVITPKAPVRSLDKMAKGESMALEGLSFIPGRHMILEQSVPKLKELLEKLQEYPNIKVEIQGHVCCTERGEDGFDHDTKDHRLSVNRAKAVYQYLVKNGIDPKRLSYRGFGGSRPKVQETSPASEQVNRRVEILIVSGAGEEQD